MLRIIDTHAHLDDETFAGDLAQVLERAAVAGVEHIVTIGDNAGSTRDALALCERFAQLSATAGVHPQHAKTCTPYELEQIAALADDPHVVGIGEIGLDFHYDPQAGEYQIPVFEQQLALAREKDLPTVIHCREAYPELLRILREAKNPRAGIVHCFSGTLEQGLALCELGYKIGVGGTVTYKNADALRAAIAGLPLDSLVLETDAPYLAPVPRRGKRNEPELIKYTTERLAAVLGLSIHEVGERTRRNAIEIFRLQLDAQSVNLPQNNSAAQ